MALIFLLVPTFYYMSDLAAFLRPPHLPLDWPILFQLLVATLPWPWVDSRVRRATGVTGSWDPDVDGPE